MEPSALVRLGAITHVAVLVLGMVACREPDPAWHYEGEEGPERWGTISAKYAPCESGRAQSPIDIVAPERRDTSDAIVLKFAPSNLRIVHHEHVADAINNGHTIQVNYS